MIGNRICAIALAAASATICFTPSAIASSFDGNWSVVAQTTQGHCGSSQFGLAINAGQLYSAGGYYVGGYPAQLGGRVSPSGYVQATAVGWPAHRPCRRTLLAVSGQRDLGGYRAVRCLLRRLDRRPSSKANVLTINREDQAPHAVCGTKSGAAKTSAARSRHPIRGARRGSWRQHVCCCLSAWS